MYTVSNIRSSSSLSLLKVCLVYQGMLFLVYVLKLSDMSHRVFCGTEYKRGTGRKQLSCVVQFREKQANSCKDHTHVFRSSLSGLNHEQHACVDTCVSSLQMH